MSLTGTDTLGPHKRGTAKTFRSEAETPRSDYLLPDYLDQSPLYHIVVHLDVRYSKTTHQSSCRVNVGDALQFLSTNHICSPIMTEDESTERRERNERNERDSHSAFFAERDWDSVASFWSNMMLQSSLPPFIQGDSAVRQGGPVVEDSESAVCRLTEDSAAVLQPTEPTEEIEAADEAEMTKMAVGVGKGVGYGLTDLQAIHAIGLEEFNSSDPRFKRLTFALRIGYDGSKYNGYQRQKGNSILFVVYGVLYIIFSCNE